MSTLASDLNPLQSLESGNQTGLKVQLHVNATTVNGDKTGPREL